MTDKALADILARTYAHRVTAFRPLAEGEERLCEAAPCALSRSEHTNAPMPPSLSAAWPEALYRLSLYTRPELAFRLGDRVEVTDEGGSVWMGRTSDSFRYDSHCVTVVEISGVEAPGRNPAKRFRWGEEERRNECAFGGSRKRGICSLLR